MQLNFLAGRASSYDTYSFSMYLRLHTPFHSKGLLHRYARIPGFASRHPLPLVKTHPACRAPWATALSPFNAQSPRFFVLPLHPQMVGVLELVVRSKVCVAAVNIQPLCDLTRREHWSGKPLAMEVLDYLIGAYAPIKGPVEVRAIPEGYPERG